jgi:hypothetical protein
MLRRLAVIGMLAGAVAVAPAAAQEPSPPGFTVTETARGGTTDVVDHPPKSPTTGARRRLSRDDSLVISNPLRDSEHRPIGRLRATCAITKAGGFDTAAGDCLGVFALKAGRLYVTLPLDLASTRSTGTILAGTGSYLGVHGTWTSVQHRDGSATDTFAFVR